MLVYLCVNLGLGHTMWRSIPKEISFYPVYTQKQTAIKEYQKQHRNNIRQEIEKSAHNRECVMVFALDIPYKNLSYIGGDILDPYTTEYDLKNDSVYNVSMKHLKHNQIVAAETWHFYIKNTRLKHKKTLAFW